MLCFQMLIGYATGQIVLWDLKTKMADYRCQTDDPLKSITWHHEGKQFMCSHSDGSLTTWTVRQTRPTNVTYPHGEIQLNDTILSRVVHQNFYGNNFFLAKSTKDGEPEPCKPIQKVEWKLSRSG